MKSPDVGFYLLHIAASCEKILCYTQDMDQSGFMASLLVQDAVLRNFEIIGEAAKHIPEEFRSRYPQIHMEGNGRSSGHPDPSVFWH